MPFQESYNRLKINFGIDEGDFVKLWVIGAFIVLALLATVYSFNLQLDLITPYFVYLFPQLYYIPIVLISVWYPRRGLQATVLLVAAFLAISAYFSYIGAPVDPIVFTLNGVLYIWVVAATTLLAREGGLISTRYKKFFDDADAGIFLLHFGNGKVLESNQRFAQLLGYTEQEMAGKPMRDVWDDEAARSEFLEKVRTGSPLTQIEAVFTAKGGEKRTLLLSCKEVVFEKMAECTAVDISNLKSLQEALNNIKHYFHQIVRATHDLVILQDITGKIERVHWVKGNEFGIDPVTLEGKMPTEILVPEKADQFMACFQQALRAKSPVTCLFPLHVNGKEITFSAVLASLHDNAGRTVGVMGTCRDVTDKTLEHLAREQLEDEIEHRRDFITTAAHELRTPLQPILGYLHLLVDDPEGYALDAETVRILRLCLENVERERRIVDRMLELSILYNGRIDLEVQEIPLRQMLESIVISGGHPVEAELDISVPDDVVIQADKSCMYQVFHTLISNAVRYNNPPRRVWISYASDAKNHYISVRDNGIGIGEKALDAIFKPFHLPDGENLSRQTNRLGLGLAIAREYVRNHGGEIDVKSRLGEGSTFTVRIPREVHNAA
ncbi:MAG: PAS domain-containing sensor histidine kinase [Methanomicrobiales archaeon]|nr:PAS domain-containing sensor histidine kinase [Methanomicrobiales archaeon]